MFIMGAHGHALLRYVLIVVWFWICIEIHEVHTGYALMLAGLAVIVNWIAPTVNQHIPPHPLDSLDT